MGKDYEQLKPEEQSTVMRMDREGSTVRAMAIALGYDFQLIPVTGG